MSIRAKLLRRLEEAEKRGIPKGIDVIVFIGETEEKGLYMVQQHIYGSDSCNHDSINSWKIKASSTKEVAENYQSPEGCKEPLIFMYDFGRDMLSLGYMYGVREERERRKDK